MLPPFASLSGAAPSDSASGRLALCYSEQDVGRAHIWGDLLGSPVSPRSCRPPQLRTPSECAASHAPAPFCVHTTAFGLASATRAHVQNYVCVCARSSQACSYESLEHLFSFCSEFGWYPIRGLGEGARPSFPRFRAPEAAWAWQGPAMVAARRRAFSGRYCPSSGSRHFRLSMLAPSTVSRSLQVCPEARVIAFESDSHRQHLRGLARRFDRLSPQVLYRCAVEFSDDDGLTQGACRTPPRCGMFVFRDIVV